MLKEQSSDPLPNLRPIPAIGKKSIKDTHWHKADLKRPKLNAQKLHVHKNIEGHNNAQIKWVKPNQ